MIHVNKNEALRPEAYIGGYTMHEHEHSHAHEHSHEHDHGHSHSHSHSHEHSHEHGHAAGFESVEQAQALMRYMLDHNRHHAEELHSVLHKLEADGNAEAVRRLSVLHKLEADGNAEAVRRLDGAIASYQDGNDLLEAALKALSGE